MVKNFEKLKKNFENAKIIYKKNNFKSFCVTITTNTSSDNKGIQVAPLRKIDDILIFGIIIYSTKQLQKITKIFDKNIDVIFVDSEKKYHLISEMSLEIILKKRRIFYRMNLLNLVI